MPARTPHRLVGGALVAALALGACASEATEPPVGRASATEVGPDAEAEATTPTTAEPTSTTESVTTTTQPATTTTAPVDVHSLRPPQPAGDPAGLAAQIMEAETTLREPSSSELEVAAASLAHQVAYRQLGTHPEWDAAVLAAIPADLHPAVERNVAARREFRAMHRTLSSTLPAWRIVPPLPADELLALYREAEAAFGIPWKYLAAINLVETATGRIRGTSSAGAQGPMQFMPATWAAYGDGGDVNDHRDAIMGAARYLAANNGAVDIDHALFRYNRSRRYVLGVRLYADLIAEHPRGFHAFHGWGVWYLTDQGDVYLPVGYEATEPVPVADHRG